MKYLIRLSLLCVFFSATIAHAALANRTYAEFSRGILKNGIYEEYKKEADAGNIEAIISKVANKKHSTGSEYEDVAKKILKPEIYAKYEKAAYIAYDQYVKPLPKVKAGGKEIIDVQKVRSISGNREIAAYRQAYISGIIEQEKNNVK